MRKILKISAVAISLVGVFSAGAVYGPQIVSRIIPNAEAQVKMGTGYRVYLWKGEL
jgi:hypothetical protein